MKIAFMGFLMKRFNEIGEIFEIFVGNLNLLGWKIIVEIDC